MLWRTEDGVRLQSRTGREVTALVLGVIVVAYVLGIDPAEAVRRVLDM